MYRQTGAHVNDAPYAPVRFFYKLTELGPHIFVDCPTEQLCNDDPPVGVSERRRLMVRLVLWPV